jgi:hypothetical protein
MAEGVGQQDGVSFLVMECLEGETLGNSASSKRAQQDQAGSKVRTLRIDPRRFMSKLLYVLNVRPGINSGMAVRAAFATQFQHT